ncbi:hypothetical protein MC7420_3133 [Coleofasciculus chthonoplastes PCC 7420]|uniref:Uncharacterized protein n=1 Tax=Coleofasciculus chthonoplastes PCC 7420 TaxID=118168 RepID=B4VJY4_9CYAN|nr:hypothetical protein [Coleofasciculus chthonoplastes]EDX77809.1 hypothetical protein MC7420_3133 [Coleofasciculus chthonoplastes PCC 7420]
MKLVASTAIALSLTFSTQVGAAPVTANASMENRVRQDQPVSPQQQIEDATSNSLMCWTWFTRCY